MDGVVTTVAGIPQTEGYKDGPALSAQFRTPSGVAVDQKGNIYVADYGNKVLRVISNGKVSTLNYILEPGNTHNIISPAFLRVDSKALYVTEYCSLISQILFAKWTPKTHHLFPHTNKEQIKVLMKLAQKKKGIARHPICHLASLPKDLLFIICGFVADNQAFTEVI